LLIVDIHVFTVVTLDKPPTASIGGCGKAIKPVNELDAHCTDE
jgi:hypothetical protein